MHDDDAVHLGDGGQAVGDGEDGLAAHDPRQRVLDLRLDLAVQRARRLVQHQDRRVLEERPRQRDPLPLPARQLHPPLAQMRVIAGAARVILERQDEVVRLGRAGGGEQLVLGGVGAAVQDVVAGRAVEQRGVLRDHAHVAAQAFLADAAHVMAVHQHRPVLDVVKPQQQRDQRGLAGPGFAHDPDPLARRDGKAEVRDPALAPAIGEGHVAIVDPPLHPAQFDRARRVGQIVRGGERVHPVLDLADRPPDPHQRHADPAGHLRQPHRDRTGRGDVARRRLTALPQQHRAADQHHRQKARDDGQRQPEPGVQLAEIDGAVAERLHRAQGRLILVIGVREELDGLDVGDRVHDLARDHRAGVGAGLGLGPHAGQEIADQPQIKRKPHQQDDRAPGIDRHQVDRAADDRRQGEGRGVDHLACDIGHGPGGLHLLGGDAAREVVVEERHGVAHRPAVQPRQHQRQDVGADDDVGTGAGQADDDRPDQHEEQHENRDQGQVVGQRPPLGGARGKVHDRAQERGRRDLGRARQGRGHARNGKPRPGPGQAPAKERHQRRGGRPLGGAEGVDHAGEIGVHHAFSPASRATSISPGAGMTKPDSIHAASAARRPRPTAGP